MKDKTTSLQKWMIDVAFVQEIAQMTGILVTMFYIPAFSKK